MPSKLFSKSLIFWDKSRNGYPKSQLPSTLPDKTGNSNTDERIPLINRFIELFGVEKIDGYLADRESIGTEFVRYLIKNEIEFRIRIQHNTRVARCRNGTAPAYNFFRNLARGEVIQLRGQRVVWGQKLSVTGTRLMSGESLIILSPDASRVTAILGDYKWRWEIETFFKTLKSQGSDFEATYLTGLDRIEKLLLGASPRGMVTRAKTDPNQESSPSGHQYFQVWFGLAESDFIQHDGKA